MFTYYKQSYKNTSAGRLDRRINLLYDIQFVLLDCAIVIEFMSFILLIYLYLK